MDIQQIHHLHELLVRGKAASPYLKEPLATLPEQTSTSLVPDLLGPVDNAYLKSADGHMLLHSRQHVHDKQRGSEQSELLSYALLQPNEVERPYDDLQLQADQNQVYLQSLSSQMNGANISHQGLPPRPYSMGVLPNAMAGMSMYSKEPSQDVQQNAAGLRMVDARLLDHAQYVARPGHQQQYTVQNVSAMSAAPMNVPRQYEVWDKRSYEQRYVKAPHHHPHHHQVANQFVPAAPVQAAQPQHIPRAAFPPQTAARGAAARRIRRYSTGSIVAYPPSWADSTWHPLAMAVSSGQLANGGTGVFLPGGGGDPSAASGSSIAEAQSINKPRRNSVAEPLYRVLENEPSTGSSPPKPEALPEEWLY